MLGEAPSWLTTNSLGQILTHSPSPFLHRHAANLFGSRQMATMLGEATHAAAAAATRADGGEGRAIV